MPTVTSMYAAYGTITAGSNPSQHLAVCSGRCGERQQYPKAVTALHAILRRDTAYEASSNGANTAAHPHVVLRTASVSAYYSLSHDPKFGPMWVLLYGLHPKSKDATFIVPATTGKVCYIHIFLSPSATTHFHDTKLHDR